MKINLEFTGLKELMAGVEKAAAEHEIYTLNKSIIEEVRPQILAIMKKETPKSSDISKSGRGWGSQRPVSTHVAEAIPAGKIKKSGTGASTTIGWEKEGDAGDYFYIKYIEWGSIYHPPRQITEKVGKQAEPLMNIVAEKKYQSFLNRVIG